MAEFVLITAWVIVIASKSEVAVLPNKDAERVPGRYDNPYSNVVFSIHDDHRVFNILLYHPDPSREGVVIIVLLVLMR